MSDQYEEMARAVIKAWRRKSGMAGDLDLETRIFFALRQADAAGFRRGIEESAYFIEDQRYNLPGREAEWSRFIAKKVRALAPEPKG